MEQKTASREEFEKRFCKEEYFSQLEELVNLDSGSTDREGVNRIASYFAPKFEALGFEVQRIRGEETGDCLVMNRGGREHYDVLFLGHMDTVFPRGTAEERPFRMDGEKAYGPGVADMKNGLLAIYHIGPALPREAADKLSLCVVMNPDEEISSSFSTPILIEQASKADHAFVMESALLTGEACMERKGMVQYTLEFQGIAAHAGYVYETRNASAILEMAHWIPALSALGDREKRTSANVGMVSGGTAVNVVPDRAVLEVEFRMWEESERRRIEAAVEEMLAHPFVEGVSVRIRAKHGKLPMSPSVGTLDFVEHWRGKAGKMGLFFDVKQRGGLSDANSIAAYVPVCLDGMGPRGGMDHGVDEHMLVSGARDCFVLLSAMLLEIARGKS